jgi:hypothetical protein
MGCSTPDLLVGMHVEYKETRVCVDEEIVYHKLSLVDIAFVRYEKGQLSGLGHIYFTSEDGFWEWLYRWCHSRRHIWVLSSHAEFHFHLLGIYEELERGRLRLDIGSLGSSPIFPTLRGAEYFLVTYDGGSDCRVTWSSASGMTLSTIFQTLEDHPSKVETILEMRGVYLRYTRRSSVVAALCCEVGIQVLEYQRRLGFSQRRLSTSGIAYHLWSRTFSTVRPRRVLEEQAEYLEREAYYGGRILARRTGRWQGEFVMLDISSAYPSVIATKLLPCGVVEMGSGLGVHQVSAEKLARMVAECVVDNDDALYPVRALEGVRYPRGKVVTILAGPELLHAYHTGRLLGIGSYLVYELTDQYQGLGKLLLEQRDYARREGNIIYEQIAKKVGVSAYGCMARRRYRAEYRGKIRALEPVMVVYVYDAEVGKLCRHIALQGHHWKTYPEGLAVDSYIPAACFVTSYVRAFMNEVIDIAGLENVYYEHTDAILLSKEGYDRLLEAGYLKDREGLRLGKRAEAETVIVATQGCYRLDSVVHAAGIPIYYTHIVGDELEFHTSITSECGFRRTSSGEVPRRLIKCGLADSGVGLLFAVP